MNFARRKREVLYYLIAGITTTAFNIASFSLLLFMSFDYRFANLIALISTKLLAFILNKVFVFHSKTSQFRESVKEFINFSIGRTFTGLLDYFGLIILVEFFYLPQKGSKYFLTIVVVVLNYVFAKLVFKKERRTLYDK